MARMVKYDVTLPYVPSRPHFTIQPSLYHRGHPAPTLPYMYEPYYTTVLYGPSGPHCTIQTQHYYRGHPRHFTIKRLGRTLTDCATQGVRHPMHCIIRTITSPYRGEAGLPAIGQFQVWVTPYTVHYAPSHYHIGNIEHRWQHNRSWFTTTIHKATHPVIHGCILYNSPGP